MKYLSHGDMKRIRSRLRFLYGDRADQLTERFYRLVGRYGVDAKPIRKSVQRWDENDIMLITYADMVQSKEAAPLGELHKFCNKHLKGAVKTVHLLPFYPWTSDDGFSVSDYRSVNKPYGKWEHIEELGKDFDLAFDLVLNHCSAKSGWFRDFCVGIAPGKHFFLEMDPKTDLSSVFRPRTSPLLTKTRTRYGDTHVWTTFSADQVDLNWQNPDLLFEFIDILFWYISKGVRILRLDAVAFCWKELGTNCIHLPQTHEIVKLLRDICEMVAPEVVILTETNVPHNENISYFGNGDEAHMVYNFSLAPLVLEALLTGDGTYLNNWATSLAYPKRGCTYLNFTASHDGVGVGPLKGLLPDERFKALTKTVSKKGGHISKKKNADGTESPYEMNITYASALIDEDKSKSGWDRFFCSQAIALSLRGIPAVYFHSLMGSLNNTAGVTETGRARTINRYKYDAVELEEMISGIEDGHHGSLFRKYVQLMRRRANYPAFHPDGKQTVFDLGPAFFALRRDSRMGEQAVFCIHNLRSKKVKIGKALQEVMKITDGNYLDIISGRTYQIGNKELEMRPYRCLWLVSRGE